jgi:uncharacterized protein (DUF2235 family)
MKTEFNNLVDILTKDSTYQNNTELKDTLTILAKKLDEVVNRMKCIENTSQDIRNAIINYTKDVDSNTPFVMSVGHHDAILRGSNDNLIAIDLEDDEPIINNWYNLFDTHHAK